MCGWPSTRRPRKRSTSVARQCSSSWTRPAARSCCRRRTPAPSISTAKPSTKEHFGYTDGFGNPDFKGAERECVPGQGKLTAEGSWEALATGEFLLGYADEAGELPVAPIPHLLGRNGTFMVYRKLHQNVATFRQYLDEKGQLYGGGKEKLAAKFVGRWRDGTPIELSPDRARSRHRQGQQPQHQFHLWRRCRRRALSYRRAHPPRPSARCLRIQRRPGQSPPHHAPRPALRRVCAGRPAGTATKTSAASSSWR